MTLTRGSCRLPCSSAFALLFQDAPHLLETLHTLEATGNLVFSVSCFKGFNILDRLFQLQLLLHVLFYAAAQPWIVSIIANRPFLNHSRRSLTSEDKTAKDQLWCSQMSTATNPDPPKSSPAFIPLEANPPILTALVHKLGLSEALAFHDVFSLDDPSLLAFVPRPALALLLVFPVSAAYESHRLAEDALLDEYKGKGEGEPVIWVKQTIRNACGLMGVLHGVLNGASRGFIGITSLPSLTTVLKGMLTKL
jgi:ubiquitin carboxyl-terminal hydrolase